MTMRCMICGFTGDTTTKYPTCPMCGEASWAVESITKIEPVTIVVASDEDPAAVAPPVRKTGKR